MVVVVAARLHMAGRAHLPGLAVRGAVCPAEPGIR